MKITNVYEKLRRYKFKAKTKDCDWVYGGCCIKENTTYILSDYEEVEVIPETVCQSINLKDSENNEIYTGDILIDNNGKKVIVVETINGWQLRNFETNRATSIYYINKYKVIGNVHNEKHNTR